MLTTLLIQFPTQGPFGADAADADRVLASEITAEPGLLWKLWLENKAEQRAGGVYVFASQEDAERYTELHLRRLASWGISGVEVSTYTVNEPLSKITRAIGL